jgi:putative effector of murein hydrolase LrgA (UPF0299 family)
MIEHRTRVRGGRRIETFSISVGSAIGLLVLLFLLCLAVVGIFWVKV